MHHLKKENITQQKKFCTNLLKLLLFMVHTISFQKILIKSISLPYEGLLEVLDYWVCLLVWIWPVSSFLHFSSSLSIFFHLIWEEVQMVSIKWKHILKPSNYLISPFPLIICNFNLAWLGCMLCLGLKTHFCLCFCTCLS